MVDDSNTTSRSLLRRLRSSQDQEAWRQFVRRYGPSLLRWSRGRGLGEADAEDATQQVLLKLVHKLRTFDYDPARGRFRAWLHTIAKHVVEDVRRSLERTVAGTGDTDAQESVTDQGGGEGFVDELVESLLLEEAESQVEPGTNPKHWQAYEMSREGRSRGEIAATLSMTPGAVSMAVGRIVVQLRQVLQRWESV